MLAKDVLDLVQRRECGWTDVRAVGVAEEHEGPDALKTLAGERMAPVVS